MKPVRHLDSLRRPRRSSARIVLRAVAGNDRQRRAPAEPGRGSVGRPIVEQIDGPMRFQVFLGLLSFHAQPRPLRRLP